MINIDPKKQLLVDASIFVAVFNKNDSNHSKAVKFFKSAQKNNKEFLVPMHCLFEIQAAIRRAQREDSYETSVIGFEKIGRIFINGNFVNNIFSNRIVDLFLDLRGGDLIYACCARFYSLTFVTFDKDFEKYQGTVNITIL